VCDAQAFGYRGPLLSSDRFTFQSTLGVPRCLAQRCMELDTVIVAYFSLQVPYCYGRVCTAGQEATWSVKAYDILRHKRTIDLRICPLQYCLPQPDGRAARMKTSDSNHLQQRFSNRTAHAVLPAGPAVNDDGALWQMPADLRSRAAYSAGTSSSTR